MSSHAQPGLLLTTARSRVLISAVGLVTSALGCMVLIGWHAHLSSLVQLRPTLAPMQYNTALCFLLAGTGLVTLTWGRVRFTQALGVVVATIAALTLSEYQFEADLGIDQLLFHAYITTQSFHVGRMSPVTAVCFLQVGLALLLFGFRSGKKWRMALIGSLGHMTGLPGTFDWGHINRIALHTAIGLCLLGVGILAGAWNAGREPGQRTPRWLPVAVGLGVVAASIVLWQALNYRENLHIMQTVKTSGANATSQVSARIEGRIRVLTRMAERWGFSGRPSQAAWEDDAKNHLRDNPEFQALEWIDASHLIQWVVPLEGNEAKLHLDRLQEGPRRKAAETAEQQHRPAITPGIELFRGGLGFIIYVPMYVGTKFDGWIACVIQAQSIFHHYLPSGVAEGDAIRISEGGRTLFERTCARCHLLHRG